MHSWRARGPNAGYRSSYMSVRLSPTTNAGLFLPRQRSPDGPRWWKSLSGDTTGFRLHLSNLRLSPRLPTPAHARLQILTDVIRDDLRSIITLRNKLAHGQWVYPLTDDLTDVAQEQMDALRLETLFSLKQKASLIESLCASVHDLVVSLPTFERDFDNHFVRIEQTRRNLIAKDYGKWVTQIRARHDRGQAEFRRRLKGSA
jgi:hypothetical protein